MSRRQPFQSTGLAELKKLDLANGRFTSRLGIRLSVNNADTITKNRRGGGPR